MFSMLERLNMERDTKYCKARHPESAISVQPIYQKETQTVGSLEIR